MIFPTPLIAQLAKETRRRYYSAKLEGLTDQAIWEELVRTILETYEEAHARAYRSGYRPTTTQE